MKQILLFSFFILAILIFMTDCRKETNSDVLSQNSFYLFTNEELGWMCWKDSIRAEIKDSYRGKKLPYNLSVTSYLKYLVNKKDTVIISCKTTFNRATYGSSGTTESGCTLMDFSEKDSSFIRSIYSYITKFNNQFSHPINVFLKKGSNSFKGEYKQETEIINDTIQILNKKFVTIYKWRDISNKDTLYIYFKPYYGFIKIQLNENIMEQIIY